VILFWLCSREALLIFINMVSNSTEPGSSESAAVRKAYEINEMKAFSHIVLAASDEYTYLITSCDTVKAA